MRSVGSPNMLEGGAEDGEGRLVLAIIREITERKRAEQEIKRLNETLEREVAERTAELAESKNELRDLLGKLLVARRRSAGGWPTRSTTASRRWPSSLRFLSRVPSRKGKGTRE